jgi:FKBP-type peptidyl-prolyl cis-trans isomerase FklB
MRIMTSIILSAFLFLGNAMAADQQKAAPKIKDPKEKTTVADQGKPRIELKSQKEKLSYTLGYDVGRRMKQSSVDMDTETFMRALKDALAGGPSAMTDEEMRAALQPLQEEMKARRDEEMKKRAEMNKELADKNKAEGVAFLAENAKKEGVVTLPSGLQYRISKEGQGKTPLKTDTVEVHYRGTLINGSEFDSSHKRGQPATFGVDKVIKGWTEALQLMKEGSQWTLYVPSDLAYGERGAGNMIGPNQVLVFDVELLSVKGPAPAAAQN